MIVTTLKRDVKDQLIRKGFELIGEIGDNVNTPKEWTLCGEGSKVGLREKEGLLNEERWDKKIDLRGAYKNAVKNLRRGAMREIAKARIQG